VSDEGSSKGGSGAKVLFKVSSNRKGGMKDAAHTTSA
jgi:hypothetical protein